MQQQFGAQAACFGVLGNASHGSGHWFGMFPGKEKVLEEVTAV